MNTVLVALRRDLLSFEFRCDNVEIERSDVQYRLLGRNDKTRLHHRRKTNRAKSEDISAGRKSIDTKRSVGFRQRSADKRRIALPANRDRSDSYWLAGG